MTLIVVGREDEVTGFALAGVAVAACRTPDEAAITVERAAAAGSGCGLVLVSPWAAQHAARAVRAAQQHKGPPVVTVMPG
jgi:vacuolar-type H+-ATPase subunit F/Vma7